MTQKVFKNNKDRTQAAIEARFCRFIYKKIYIWLKLKWDRYKQLPYY